MSRPVLGDVINAQGDLFVSFTVPALAAGRIQIPFAQAVRAMNYGWRWKGADAWHSGDVAVWIERGGPTWMKRRR